jgi:hypothetical protein
MKMIKNPKNYKNQKNEPNAMVKLVLAQPK